MLKIFFLASLFGFSNAFAAETPKLQVKKGESRKISESSDKSGLIDMSFPEPTPIADVSRWVSAKLGKNLIFSSDAKEKIQIVAPNPVTAEEALKLYISAIGIAGYELRDEGRVARLVRKQN